MVTQEMTHTALGMWDACQAESRITGGLTGGTGRRPHSLF